MKMTLRMALPALLAFFCLAAAQATGWLDADIGAPGAAGGHTEVAGALSVTGAGTGETTSGNDQLHFTYTQADGDIDVIARIASFTGNAHARAGIMLRTSNDASAVTTGQIALRYMDASDGKHNLYLTGRDQGTATRISSGMTTRMALPVWLRLVRIGKLFAVYKSGDGRLWSQMSNTSGWQFTPTGTIQVGFFAAGGTSTTTATATFDNISLGTPNMGYKSSWFGNTFGGTPIDGHVSNGISALWTLPDGTCFTNSYYDEGGAEAAKIYKDGKVIKSFRAENEVLGNSFAGEGSITSDGTNVFIAAYHYLMMTDLLGHNSATRPMYLTVDPYDTTKSVNIISGLVKVNNDLFVGDAREQKIRVVRTNTPYYYTAGNSTINITQTAIDTTGVANAAPAVVYQTQRECDYLPYKITGLAPSTTYTVRCHFAEFTETTTGKRLINVYASGATSVPAYDVIANSGGPFKPAVLTLPNARSDANGTLWVTFERATGGDGHIVINGIELLNTSGVQAFAINCAGPAVGGFRTEINEIPERAFPFTRPGPMTADSRGELWIIQEARDFPVGTGTTIQYPAAIKCYRTDGTFTGREITDVLNPTALAYDAANDRLLVADNSSNRQIRFYTNLATAPTFAGTFGVQGGLYAGTHPGLLYDPDAGGWARFYGLTGVGIDAQGNIYVSSSLAGSDLRQLAPDGRMTWKLNGLPFCNTPDIDPDTDGADALTPYFRASLDYTQTVPGAEWAYQAYNWDASRYGAPPRSGGSQAIVRRVGPNRARILYTSGQGSVDYAGIFRYDGDIAVPCGQIRNSGAQVWIDANGDGLETADEVTTITSPGGMKSFHVDDRGEVWMALMANNTVIMRHFFLKGMTAHGAPIFGTAAGDYEDISFPGTGTPISTWGQIAQIHYDVERDVMYLLGPAKNRASDQENPVGYLARYDFWSTGNRTARWLLTLPDPATDTNFMYEVGNPWGCAYHWMGMDVAADKLYLAGLWGQVYVFNTTDGTVDRILNAGPEVGGCNAWEDATMGLSAFKRGDGETIVFTENSGYNALCNMFRIPPDPNTNIPPVVRIASPANGVYFVAPASVPITALALDDDGSIIRVDFYSDGQLIGTAMTKPYSINWANAPLGTHTLTAKATDNAGNVTTSAPVTISMLADAPPTVSIASPANNTVFSTAPATVTLTANAADVDGTISRVDYYNGATLIGSATAAPYTVTWTNVLPGSYSLTAVATDDDNSTTTSAPITITVIYCTATNLFAGLTVGSVVNGQFGWTRDPATDTFSGNYGYTLYSNTEGAPVAPPSMVVRAGGSSGHMYAYRDLGTTGGLSYWKITGDLKFAYNNINDKRTQICLLVKDSAGNIIANLDRLTWNWGGTVYVRINGKDVVAPCTWPDTSTIDNLCNAWNSMSLELYNGVLKFTYGGNTVTTTPLSGSDWHNPKTLCIMVGENNYYGESLYLDNLTLYTPATNAAPTVNLTAPADGAVLQPGTMSLAATAADSDGTVTQVDFYSETTLLGSDTTAPYALDWLNVPAGSYTLTAVATDNLGAATTSAPVSIRVNALPTVSLTAPANGAVYANAPATITLAASTGDADGTVTKVEFYNGTTLLNTDTTAPYTYDWTGVPAGTYTLTAKTNDSDGAVTDSVAVTVRVNAPPAVTLTSPADSTVYATAPATIPLAATASDADGGIQKVEFYNGTTLLNTDTSAPYNFSWANVAAGAYTLTAKAYDSDGVAVTSSAVTVRVNAAPTVALTSPANGASYPNAPVTIPLAATANDTNGTIAKVEFYNGTTLLNTDTTAPYSYSWSNIAAGTYTLTAKAYDSDGAVTASTAATVTVTGPVNVPPAVTITSPTNGALYLSSVPLAATATDSDGTVTKVEFYQDATLIATTTTAPYSATWTPTTGGKYSITARAYDNSGATTTSAAAAITVWLTGNVGSTGVAGSASLAGATFTVTGGGVGMTGKADACRYVYLPVSGNSTITARMASFSSSTTAAAAGVMLRQSTAANSIMVAGLFQPANTKVTLTKRTGSGNTASSKSVTANAAPIWLRLVRSGTTVTVYRSTNGTSWTSVGSASVTLSDPVLLGLCVNSGKTTTTATATFDNVSVTQP